jgi:uncharacterized protein YegP (UPF0339 family)
MAHKFVIEQNKKGEYVAKFKYNGEIMFWTEGYSSKANAVHAIESIKKNGPGAPTEEAE